MQQRDKYTIALLAAYALALHGFERLIPTPVPWLRFGLANIITLVAMLMYGFRVALTVTLIRVTVGSFVIGTFLGPAFILSLSGGVFSVLSMGMVHRTVPRTFSPLGLSLIGAFFHNVGQIVVAYALFLPNMYSMLVIAPLILFLGTITGCVNGMFCIFVLEYLKTKSVLHN
ncbi:MAG: Gx transporter family protein [Candidatus Magnetobacterium sp. LHC-1]|uniref:Gx transporter family protein n=1 Tax=Candidatus Magnetobacterium casense TaxID=1455061 RepID=A0ABS6RX95_9BACT|nr:Gx transporter family protein [Candidatus Magnetobacterium casensis]MBV6341251.1 Gx transporter family protein [Candidatus Magnetobacterium casensis]